MRSTLAAALRRVRGGDGPTRPSADGERDVDVAVIGAGIAGLAAAGASRAAGRSCVVLEARDRVGGRIWTSDAWPIFRSISGASWIHGTDGNPVYDEANRLGIATTVFDVGSSDGAGSAVYHSGSGSAWTATTIDAHGPAR